VADHEKNGDRQEEENIGILEAGEGMQDKSRAVFV
jgi:hypothetical protein